MPISLRATAAKLGAAALLAASVVAMSGGNAQAATYDGADPATTYCGGTTSTPSSQNLTFSDGSYAGTVYLRYNSDCRTLWAKIVLNGTQDYCGNAAAGHACATAAIHRNSDGAELSCQVPVGGSSCYTNMLNDATSAPTLTDIPTPQAASAGRTPRATELDLEPSGLCGA